MLGRKQISVTDQVRVQDLKAYLHTVLHSLTQGTLLT